MSSQTQQLLSAAAESVCAPGRGTIELIVMTINIISTSKIHILVNKNKLKIHILVNKNKTENTHTGKQK